MNRLRKKLEKNSIYNTLKIARNKLNKGSSRPIQKSINSPRNQRRYQKIE
jgi:hypothetical protein